MTDPLNPNEAAALLAAATPGPWRPYRNNVCGIMGPVTSVASDLRWDDAAAIVWLRNHADALLAAYRETERLRGALEVALALPDLLPGEHFRIESGAGAECHTCGLGWPCELTLWREQADAVLAASREDQP